MAGRGRGKGGELSNLPFENSKIPEKERKMVPSFSSLTRVHFALYIYTRIGISGWVIGDTKAVQSRGGAE